MSYDLAVFDPRTEFRERSLFMQFYESQTNWQLGVDYTDPAFTTPGLREWYREMIETFPPMNGPLRPSMENTERWEWVADYGIGTGMIYVGFPWSKAQIAYEAAYRLATKHAVGFCDSSGEGGAWFPTEYGTLELTHKGDGRPEGRFAKLMAEAQTGQAVHCESLEDAVTKMTQMVGDPSNAKPIIIAPSGTKADP